MSGIRVEIQLADKSFTSGLLRAGQSLKQFKDELSRTDPHFRKLQGSADGTIISFKKAEEGSRGLIQRLRDLAVVGGGAVLMFRALSGASNSTLGNIVKVNAEMERLRFQLAGLSKAGNPTDAMKDANRQVREIQELAKTTPFAMNELVNSFVKMRVTGIDETTRSLKVLTDGVAAFGGSEESLHRITLGLTQMAGKGVIQMEELRQQLGESMPSAMKLMARSMGVSVGELTKQIATGRVEAQTALRKWLNEVELTYGGRGKEMMKTFSGQLSLIRTSFTQLVTAEDSQIRAAFEQLKGIMERVGKALQSKGAKDFFDAIGVGMQNALSFAEMLATQFGKVSARVQEMSGYLITGMKLIAGAFVFNKMVAGYNLLRTTMLGVRSNFAEISLAMSAVNRQTMLSNRMAALSAAQAVTATRRQATLAAAAAAAGVGGGRLTNLAAVGTAMAGTGFMAKGASTRIAPSVMGGLLAGAGGLQNAMGAIAKLAARVASAFVPVGIALTVFGPLAWDVSKAIWSWWKGADETKKAIVEASAAANEMRRQQLAEDRKALERSHAEQLARAKQAIEDRRTQGDQALGALTQRRAAERAQIERENAKDVAAAERAAKRLRDAADTRAQRHGGEYDAAQEQRAIEAEERIAKVREEAANRLARHDFNTFQDQNATNYQINDIIEKGPMRAFEELKKALAEQMQEFDKGAGEAIQKTMDENAEATFQGIEDRLRGQVMAAQSTYEQAADRADRVRETRMKVQAAMGRSSVGVQAQYRQDMTEATKTLLETEIALWETEQERVRGLVAAGTESGRTLGFINDKISELKERMAEATGMRTGVKQMDPGEDPVEAQKRLDKATENAKDSVRELEAELRGASGEVAKLLSKIARGDFGKLDDGSEYAANMRKELVEATLAAEVLKGVLDDVNSVKSDYDRIIENQQQRMVENEAYLAGIDTTDEAAFMEWKFQNGKLPIDADAAEMARKKIAELTDGLEIQEQLVIKLGESLRNNAFGNETIEAIGRVQTAIGGLSGVIGTVISGLQGVGNSIGSMFSGGIAGFAGSVVSGGLDGYYNAIKRHESGGKANAKNDKSTATGLYQFLKDTWLGLMKSHPELGLTADGRTDPAQNERAIRAFTADNIKSLNAQGIPITNASLYGAHFLGTGAVAAPFKADPNTMMSDLVTGDVLTANPFLRKMTAGEFIRWADKAGGGTGTPQNITLDPSAGQVIQPAVNEVLDRRDEANDNRPKDLALQQAADLLRETNRLRDELAGAQLEGRLGENVGQNRRALEEKIASGMFGSTDASNPIFADAIAAAEAADAAQKSITEGRKADNEISTQGKNLAEERVELAQKEAEARERFKDPNYRGQSEDLRRLNEQSKEYLDNIAKRHGVDSDLYKQESARVAEARASLMRTQGYDAMGELKQSAKDAQREAMLPRDAAKLEYDERIAKLTSLRDYAIQMGASVAEAEKLYAEAVHAEKMKYLQEYGAGLTQKLAGMMDVEGQINQKVGGWVDGLSDALYDWISGGEGDGFKGVLRQVREDIARSVINAATGAMVKPFQEMLEGPNGIGAMLQKWVSSLFDKGGAGGAAGGAPGVAAGGGFFQAIANWIKNLFSGMFGVKHTGGIVGHGGGTARKASMLAFAGAPRFHTGGIIKSTGMKMGLAPGEVPIIAKKGEGVFTPEQMKALGGTVNSQAINITGGSITVNGGGGSPEQNADLAARIGLAQEKAMRALVQDQMMREMRAGGMLQRK